MIKLDYLNFKKQIEKLIFIKTPIIWVNTKEEEKAEKGVIESILIKYNSCKYFYIMDDTGTWRIDPITRQPIQTVNTQDITQQLNESYNSGFSYPDTLMGNGILELLTRCPDSVALIIRNLSSVYSNTNFQRGLYNLTVRNANVNKVYNPIIILAPTSQIPQMLRESSTLIDLPLFTETENKKYIEGWMQANKIEQNDSIEKLGKAAAGLTIFQANQALKNMVVNNGNAKYLYDVKTDIIKQSGVLTYVNPERTLDKIGGHDLIKNWIRQTKQCMTPEAKKFGIQTTKGAICMGLAGTGKSLIAEAIANYFEIPLIIFDLSKIMGGLVGQSERTAREAFELINSLGKCVILMDEADKKFAGTNSNGQHDGGTFARVFDIVLENLQSNKEQFYILTANDISKLPSPLMRAGRLDTKWFFDLPNENERLEIFKIHFGKSKHNVSQELLNYAVKLADHFTGAEIETAVNNILKSAFLSNKIIDKVAIASGINLVSPIWKTNRDEIQKLKEYAQANNIPCTSSNIASKHSAIKIKGGEDRIRNLEEVANSAVAS